MGIGPGGTYAAKGAFPEKIPAFRSGITVDNYMDIPPDCLALCTWVPRFGRWYHKYGNYACPHRTNGVRHAPQ